MLFMGNEKLIKKIIVDYDYAIIYKNNGTLFVICK